MNFSKLSYNEALLKSGIMINNSETDTAIAAQVALYGYTNEKIGKGKQILAEATNLYEAQKKEYGEQDQAQDDFTHKKVAAQKDYSKMIKLARIALKNDVQATTTLELNGRRSPTISGWVQQTRNFYNAILANEKWKMAMAEFGQTDVILNEKLAQVDEVVSLMQTLKKETGDAQNATEIRNLKFDELSEWINDYEQVARIALEDQPQLLEKLGIIVKN